MRCKKKPSTKKGLDGRVEPMGVVREGGTKKQAKRKRAAARLQKRMKRGREVAVLRKSNRAGLGMRCKKKPSTKEGADGHVGLMDVIREGDTKKQENCSKVAKKNEAKREAAAAQAFGQADLEMQYLEELQQRLIDALLECEVG